jgi:hypothetical protein
MQPVNHGENCRILDPDKSEYWKFQMALIRGIADDTVDHPNCHGMYEGWGQKYVAHLLLKSSATNQHPPLIICLRK